MITDINSEDRLVQQTFAEHLRRRLQWETIYAWNDESFGPGGTLGRANERDVVLVRDVQAALARLNPNLPEAARNQAIEKLVRVDFSRSLVQHNREYYGILVSTSPAIFEATQAQVAALQPGLRGKLRRLFESIRRRAWPAMRSRGREVGRGSARDVGRADVGRRGRCSGTSMTPIALYVRCIR